MSKSLLVPLDFSTQSEAVLETAHFFAESTQAKVHLLHVYREKPTWADALVTPVSVGMTLKHFDVLLRESAEVSIDKSVEKWKSYGPSGTKLTYAITEGSASDMIVKEAERGKHDLIIMGRKGHGIAAALAPNLLGGIVERVLRMAKKPVLVIGEKPLRKIVNILVPIDFYEASEDALRFAVTLAKSFDARIICMHVQEPPLQFLSDYPGLPATSYGLNPESIPHLQRANKERLADFCRPYETLGVDLHTTVAFGDVARQITAFAEKELCDLLIVGNVGRKGMGRLILGSTAERVVRTAPCPALVVKMND